ncbi:MAG: ATP-dependent helicase [Alphaproteobacteria bacterium]
MTIEDDDWLMDEPPVLDIPKAGLRQEIDSSMYSGTGEIANPEWLDKLNEAQKQAVSTLDGPLLVLAGAGTGKTRVLTSRLAMILRQGRATHGQILCVTFTNKAAQEMRARVETLLGHGTDGMWIGTFHSLATRILRRHADLVGFNRDFTILDSDDQVRLIKQLSKDYHIDPKKWPPRALLHEISRWKDRALSPDQVPKTDYQALEGSKLDQLYAAYHEQLAQLNAMDFGDLLLYCIILLNQNPMLLEEYQRRFSYILVDEYQDTNVAQYLWLRLLARNSGGVAGVHNICCVGDDDQSIYGWRGAEIENILRFEKDYPGAEIVKLECNYRSSEAILAAASAVIANNKGRHGKSLWTDRKGGTKLQVRGVWDDYAEARLVADDMVKQKVDNDVKWSSFAVLVRASFQTRPFEEQFIAKGISYRVIGGLRFYEREEARDLLAYLRLIKSQSDNLAFMRIVNKPARGIGATSQAKIREWAENNQSSMFHAGKEMLDAQHFKGAAKTGLTKFYDFFQKWEKLNFINNHCALAESVVEDSGMARMWRESNLPDAPGRLENLSEFIAGMGEFESLISFLDHVALVMEANNAKTGDYASIMTLHGAKGLEFDQVYLPGWEEQVFPNPRALNEKGQSGIEEERRLAYVGITRARHRAMISYAAQRRVFGETLVTVPSRFLKELPADYIDASSSVSNRYQQSSYGSSTMPSTMPSSASRTARTASSRAPSSSKRFIAGDRVFHDKFGAGTVRKVEHPHIMVTFDHTGDKLLFADYLHKINEESQ